MKTKLSLVSSLLLFAIFVAACGSQPSAPGAGSQGEPVKDYASLIDALQKAGATIEPGGEIEQPFFTVKGQVVKINGVDVQTFEYETAEKLEAEAIQIAPDGGSIGTTMVTWVATPHFFKVGRILAVYVGDDQVVLDLLNAVLGTQFAGR